MSELVKSYGEEFMIQRKECAEKLAELGFMPTEEYPENTDNPWIGRQEQGTPYGAHKIFVVPHMGVHYEPTYFISPELNKEEATETVHELPRLIERITVMKYEGYWGFTNGSIEDGEDIRVPLDRELLNELEEHEIVIPLGDGKREGRIIGKIPSEEGTVLDLIGTHSEDNNVYDLRIMLHAGQQKKEEFSLLDFNPLSSDNTGELAFVWLKIDEEGLLRLQNYDSGTVRPTTREAKVINQLHEVANTETKREYPYEVSSQERENAPFILYAHHNAAELLSAAKFS